MKYITEVQVRQITKELLMREFCHPEQFLDSCSLCPYYGKRWSCPSGIPDTFCYLEPYSHAFLVAVKVFYPDEVRSLTISEQGAEKIRQESYEVVKKKLLLALLDLEQEVPGGKCLGAGKCILCDHCTREEGSPCRYPEERRYSITGFGFDFSKILQELFEIPLLWSSEGLPEYDVAVAALFYE